MEAPCDRAPPWNPIRRISRNPILQTFPSSRQSQRQASTQEYAHTDEGAGDGAMMAHSGQVHDGVPGSTVTADHLALESALRAAVAERLGELRFGLWFGEEVHLGLSGDGNALEVQVPNAFFREWIRSHFSASLVEAAQAITGRQVQLSFAVQNEIDPPLGDVIDQDADQSQQRSGSTVTVPIPGNLKAPLSFPAPHPSSPDRLPAPRFKPPATDRIQSQNYGQHAANGQASRLGLSGVPTAVRLPRLLNDFV